jgi:glycine cleavage system H protein
MSELPGDLLYTSEHEWLRRESDGNVTIGVELPEVGQDVESGGDMAVVESVKAASDVYSPIDGSVVEVNEALADDPEKINTDPYGEGWIVKVAPSGDIDESAMLNPDAYQALLDEEEA